MSKLEISHNRATFGGFAALYGFLAVLSLLAANYMVQSLFDLAPSVPVVDKLLLNKLLLILYLVTAFLFSALGFYYVNFLLLIDRIPGLVIDHTGIRYIYLGDVHIPWSEIERIEERPVLGYTGIIVVPRDAKTIIARIHPFKRACFQLQKILRRGYFDIETGYLKQSWNGRLIDEIARWCPPEAETEIVRAETDHAVFVRPLAGRVAIAMNMVLVFLLLYVSWEEGYLPDFPGGVRFWLLFGILIAPYVNTVALFQAETQSLRLGSERSFWDVKIPALVMNAGVGLIPLPAIIPLLIKMAIQFTDSGWSMFVSMYSIGGLSVFAALLFVATSLTTLIALLPDSLPRLRASRPAMTVVRSAGKRKVAKEATTIA